MLFDGGHARRRGVTGRALALAVLLAGLVLGAVPAGAHNNRTVLAGERGPYDLVVAVADVSRGADRGLLVEVAVRTAGDRRGVDGATVAVSGVAAGSTVGPLPADDYGSTYRVLLPGADVVAWDLTVAVAAPGLAAVEVEVTAPGPATLHGESLVDSGAEPRTPGWAGGVVLVAAAVVGLGLTGTGRFVTPGAAVLLVLAAAAVVGGAWSASSAGTAAKALSALPAVVAAGALLVGVGLVDRRDDARALVFAGAAGLAVVAGWSERAVLTDRYVGSALSPVVARAAVTVVLGVGVGLAVLVVLGSRAALRSLLPTRP